LGIILVRTAPHVGVRGVHVRSVEDCNMAGLSVEELHAEYLQLKADLNDEVSRFEYEKKQHQIRVRKITEDLTKKWFEYQLLKQEQKK
jgi:uncharacterized protein (DUF433 family)